MRDTYVVFDDLSDTERYAAALGYVWPNFHGPTVALLARIFVPPTLRGRGYGRRVLEEVCADADSEGVELWLQVEPDDPNDEEWVVALYRSVGFEWDEDHMTRAPRTTNEREEIER